MSRSAEWIDLRLALRVLQELKAQPLVWSLPLPGAYDNDTPVSVVARGSYYDRYEHIVERARVPWLDFRDHEEFPYFLTDPGSHLSARGWVFADRALDMFWHGLSTAEIRSSLSTLAKKAPSGSPPSDLGSGVGDLLRGRQPRVIASTTSSVDSTPCARNLKLIIAAA